LEKKKTQNLSFRPLERVKSSRTGPSAIAGQSKLGLGSNPAKGRLGLQGKGGGEREGTTTYPFEGLAGLGEAGKMVAGGRQ
jgi:hypothetical protein